MADISGYIRIINEAEKGEAVRDAITGALEEMNTYGGNASTLENHPASYFATATFFTAVAEQVGEVDDVLIAIENGLNALKYDMGEYTLSGSGGSFTVDCTGIKGYDNLDISKFYFEILGGSNASQAGNWTPSQSYNPETGVFTYSWGALSSNINVKLWIVKPTHTTVGVQIQPLVITENGNWDAGNNAAYNPVTIRVPNVIDVRKLTQSITKNGAFTFTPEPNTGFSEVTLHVDVPMPREKVIINKTFTENGTYRAIDEEPAADGYGIVTVNVDSKILIEDKRITENGYYQAIDEGGDGYIDVIVDVDPEAVLGHKTIAQNGDYDAEDDGFDGYSSVNVVVPQQVLGSKTITANGTYDPLDEDPKLDGFNSVTVNVPQIAAVLGSKTITSNGTYDPKDDSLDGYDSVTVNTTTAVLGSKTITSNGTYDPKDDSLDGYDSVTVNISGGRFDPDDYTTYIESDSNSWIDIGYKVKNNSRFEIVADVNSNNSQYAVLCGVRTNNQDTNTNGFFVFTKYNGNNNCSITFGSSRTDITPNGVNMPDYFYDHKSMYTIKKNTAMIDNGDEKIANVILNQQYTVTEDYSVYIFSLNQSGSEYGSVTRCIAKLYAFNIYEGDNLVMNLVPFLDGNTPCLKDVISGNMYYNSGSGTLTYGEDN